MTGESASGLGFLKLAASSTMEAILPVAFAVIALRYALFAVKHMRLSVIDEDVL